MAPSEKTRSFSVTSIRARLPSSVMYASKLLSSSGFSFTVSGVISRRSSARAPSGSDSMALTSRCARAAPAAICPAPSAARVSSRRSVCAGFSGGAAGASAAFGAGSAGANGSTGSGAGASAGFGASAGAAWPPRTSRTAASNMPEPFSPTRRRAPSFAPWIRVRLSAEASAGASHVGGRPCDQSTAAEAVRSPRESGSGSGSAGFAAGVGAAGSAGFAAGAPVKFRPSFSSIQSAARILPAPALRPCSRLRPPSAICLKPSLTSPSRDASRARFSGSGLPSGWVAERTSWLLRWCASSRLTSSISASPCEPRRSTSDFSTTVSGAVIPGSNLSSTSRRFSADSACPGISLSMSITNRVREPSTASGIITPSVRAQLRSGRAIALRPRFSQ